MTYTPGAETLRKLRDLVVEARPSWDPALVLIVCTNLAAQRVDGTDLAIAALRCASDDNLSAAGPKAIGWRGPHWRDLGTCPVEAAAPARCGVCGRREPDCYSARPGPDDHVFEPRDPRLVRRRG